MDDAKGNHETKMPQNRVVNCRQVGIMDGMSEHPFYSFDVFDTA